MLKWFSTLLQGPKESSHDAFWYKYINIGVLQIAAMLERDAYEQMKKPGGGIADHNSDFDTRIGMTFSTALSRRTAIYDHTVIRAFIEDRCAKVNKARAAELTENFRIIHENPVVLPRLEKAMPTSYVYVKEGLFGKDCKNIFYTELSDQLAFCEECHARPILYSVIKDEDRMRRHLGKHRNGNTKDKALRDLLLSTLQ